ncbi:MAG: alpha-1,2-fucosyltransferase, partial [Alphaproteobacteria bacterium]
MVSGLGNQMFQYAAARALAERHGVEVVIDRRALPDAGDRAYALRPFRITGREGRPEELPPRRRDTSLAAYIRWHLDPRSPRLFRERPRRWPWQVQRYGWDPRFERLGGHVCLIGYFQSERFFKAIEPIIRRDFTLKAPPPAPVARILEDMARDCAVSLHVRRGDYVRNPVFNRVHGTVGPDYYLRALELIAERAGIDPVVYAFSDDPAWV